MARVRSPNYPAISLREAIDRVQLLFGKAHTKLISREQAVEAMGYDGLHGASLGAVSAVLKYGLLEKVDKQVKVSERAMSIIAPHNDEERQTAIHDAAFSPPLFGEIYERFLGEIPNDEKLRSFLIRKNFSSSALDRVIRSYRETMELVTDDSKGYAPQELQPRETEKPVQHVENTAPATASQPAIGGMRVSIVDDRLEVSANLSDAESVEKLIRVLEANKNLLPERKSVETSADEAQTQSGVAFMITQDQRQVLGALGYSEDAIKHMTPDESHEILRVNKRAAN